MSAFTNGIIRALLPKGAAWEPAFDGDFDKFLDAYAANIDSIKDFLATLSHLRDPLKTPLLDELEIEYGITRNENFTELQRREFLNVFISQTDSGGSIDDLEDRLQSAGFPVQVHANDPAIDPFIIIDQQFRMVAGGDNAYAGRQDAYAKRVGGELIVNGEQFKQVPNYLSVAAIPNAVAGNSSFVSGVFDQLNLFEIEYPVPSNPSDWPLIFFIGGDATVNGGGFLTRIEEVNLPLNARNEYLKIILKYKPLHTWAVSVVGFTE